MITLIIKKTFYSILIIAGVLLLTFFLFRVAAGDPARTVLGKKPSPEEVEELRSTLASDKPMFWGHWRKTEIYSSADFSEKHLVNGIRLNSSPCFTENALDISGSSVNFLRNFDAPDINKVRVEITYSGTIECMGKKFSAANPETVNITIKNSPLPEKINLASTANGKLYSIHFSKYQKHAWDSQLLAAFGEIISFRKTFPYISVFNFGHTLVTKEPVKDILLRGIPPSLSLMLPIFFGELILGIILALCSTAFQNKWPDRLIMLISIAGMSISYVVLLIFGQWYLGYYFNLFPVWGYGSPKYLVLPVTIGIISGLGGGVRFYRTIFVNELKREYLRTAQAKGCSSYKIYFHHLLRNAAVPLITRATTILPFLFTGSLLLESFFGIPGLGYAGINALKNSDLQMIKAIVILTAILFVMMNLLSDIAYAWADPRVRK